MNLLHAGGIWFMHADGSQNTDPTLLWIEDGMIFCDWRGNDLDMKDNLVVTHRGRCAAKVQEGTDRSDLNVDVNIDSDDSLADLFVEMQQCKKAARTVSLECLVCGLHAVSSSQQHKHMTSFHVESDPYQCSTCDSWFLTFHNLRVHEHNVHKDCHFACVWCAVTAPTRIKIRKHMCVHSDHKVAYAKCPVKLSSKDALYEHLRTLVYPCVQCNKEFSSGLAAQIHFRGKHGEGYCCTSCNKRFDAPIQKVCHEWLCLQERLWNIWC